MTKLHAFLCSVELLLIIVILIHVPLDFADTLEKEISQLHQQLTDKLN